eukprot:10993859-Alexandrium_andersonii.AAC.1
MTQHELELGEVNAAILDMFLQATEYITAADTFHLTEEQRLIHRAPGATGCPSCASPGFSEIDFALVPKRWASS